MKHVIIWMIIFVFMTFATNDVYVPGEFRAITKGLNVRFVIDETTSLKELFIDNKRQTISSTGEYIIASSLKQYFIWETTNSNNEFYRLQIFIVKSPNTFGVCAGSLTLIKTDPNTQKQKIISKKTVEFEYLKDTKNEN